MADELNGKKIAFLTANEGVEEVELTEPRKAVEAAGGNTELLAPEAGDVQAFNHLDKAETYEAGRAVGDAKDNLRTHPEAVQFVKDFFTAGKPVGVICHGPWTLVEADVVKGRKLTSWPSLQTDLRNAGAEWVDEEVVIDQGLVTSRKPDDLEAFNAKIVEEFVEGKHAAQRS
jgi:protease I